MSRRVMAFVVAAVRVGRRVTRANVIIRGKNKSFIISRLCRELKDVYGQCVGNVMDN